MTVAAAPFTDQPCAVTVNGDGSLTVQQPGPVTAGSVLIQGQTAGRYNFKWDKDDAVSQTVSYLTNSGAPISLTGYNAFLRIYRVDGPDSGQVVIEASTANGMITVSGNSLTLGITEGALVGLAPATFNYEWLLWAPTGAVTRLLQGLVTLVE